MLTDVSARTRIAQELEELPLESMTLQQITAFTEFQSLYPACRLHGSAVYGLATPDADLDVCIDEGALYSLPDEMNHMGLGQDFKMVHTLLHLRLPRVVLRHRESGI